MMGYSHSAVTVENARPYIDSLLGAEEVVWRTSPRRARWLAAKIREALTIAREDFPEEYPEFAAMKVKVEVLSGERVRARPRDIPQVEVDSVLIESVIPRVRAASELGTFDTAGIKARWEIKSPLEERLHFPEANLPKEGLLDLYEWAQANGVLMFENAGAVTLLPLQGNEDSADYAFTPADLVERFPNG